MLLAVDIGNSSIKLGVFDRETLMWRSSLPTDIHGLDRLRVLAAGMPLSFEGVIVSSVVPELNNSFSDFSESLYGIKPIFVDHAFNLGLIIKYEPPSATGIDRLIAASAAAYKYGKPCVVCDFGTATTIDAVNRSGEYLGGTITPGINTLSRALFQNTSKLPEIEVKKPLSVIGNSTETAIVSGIYYGYIGLVEGLLKRIIDELGEKAVVIATGGVAEMIAGECSAIEVVDNDLVLEGLQMIHQKI